MPALSGVDAAPLLSLLISRLSPATICSGQEVLQTLHRSPGEGPRDSISESSGHLGLPGGADVPGAMPTCHAGWPGWPSLGPH